MTDREFSEMRCFHCDKLFPQKYLRWHFARRKPADRCEGQSLLVCRWCGNMTPVRWQFEEEQP
jgi:hypothetical protein